jgi:hypothetical protein
VLQLHDHVSNDSPNPANSSGESSNVQLNTGENNTSNNAATTNDTASEDDSARTNHGVPGDSSTTRKCHSFIGYFKFIDTNECIQIIFIGPKTDEYKLIFIGLGHASANI